MTIEREIVYDKEFVEKLNKLNTIVKFRTEQEIDRIIGKKEWMDYIVTDRDNTALVTISDAPDRASLYFSNDNYCFNKYAFDDLMKIFEIAKSKVDELNRIHEEIERQRA